MHRSFRLTAGVACLVAAALFVAAALASTGVGAKPDPSFGHKGVVLAPLGAHRFDFSSPADVSVNGLVLAPHGRFVAAGTSIVNNAGRMRLAGFRRDGSRDAAFGNGGFSDGPPADATAGMVRRSDGELFVAASRPGGGPFVAAFTPAGKLDPRVGAGGVVSDLMPPNDEGAILTIALQRDGKILLGGISGDINTQFLFVERLNRDGTKDAGFGRGGLDEFALGDRGASGLAVQPDGRIVASGSNACAGEDSCNIDVLRLRPDGSLDPSFGSGGITSTAIPTVDADNLTLQRDGKIVVVGTTGTLVLGFEVVRYTSSGKLDGAFGHGGKVHTRIGPRPSAGIPTAALQQPDGKIVVAGGSTLASGKPSSEGFAIIRYRRNGSIDPSFGRRGTITPLARGMMGGGDALVRQPNGRLVLAGAAHRVNRPGLYFALVRY